MLLPAFSKQLSLHSACFKSVALLLLLFCVSDPQPCSPPPLLSPPHRGHLEPCPSLHLHHYQHVDSGVGLVQNPATAEIPSAMMGHWSLSA